MSVVTLVLVGVLLFVSRQELWQAWLLLQRVDLMLLAWIIPLQALSYYTAGAMVFSYLKGKDDMPAGPVEMGKIALELNFVNHILPSGGVSGASYMTWRLRHLGIGAARATLAQVVRFAATFMAFLALMLVALLAITLDGNINRLTILVSTGIASTIVFGSLFAMYVANSNARLQSFSRLISRLVNSFGRRVLRRKQHLIEADLVAHYFTELHDDYLMLKREPRLLVKPFLWGIIYNLAEVSMFWLVFWALGTPVNPAPLLIAYGVATMVGFFVVTPGGAGGYELAMIAFLAGAGIGQSAVVAAVLLTRALLILGTIASGSVFYYLALGKYGKRPA